MTASSQSLTDTPPETRKMTPEQARDPDYWPGLATAIPLGIQHILAMFLGNLAPAIIVANAAGFGYGSDDPSELLYMIQMAMLFAGVATLFQTMGAGPIGGRLPIVQGTSFAFIPIMIPLVAGKGVDAMAALTTGVFFGGLFHAALSLTIKRIRFALPPLVIGIVVLMIGISLVEVGVQYSAGGVELAGTESFGNGTSWLLAAIVVVSTFLLTFYTRGIFSTASVLLGLIVGYVAALFMGKVSFDAVSDAGFFMIPTPFHFGFEISIAAVIGFSLMSVVSAIEGVGNVTAITRNGARREAKDSELSGVTLADGLGTALAGIFGALPNTSFAQNVGLVAMTGVMSRHIVSLGAVFLIFCGLIPKVGAVVTTIPIEVLGGGVIIMFGMVASAALSVLSLVDWTQRNMMIFAVSISLGLGLELVPESLQHLPEGVQVFLASGVLPAAVAAIVLNLILPQEVKR